MFYCILMKILGFPPLHVAIQVPLKFLFARADVCDPAYVINGFTNVGFFYAIVFIDIHYYGLFVFVLQHMLDGFKFPCSCSRVSCSNNYCLPAIDIALSQFEIVIVFTTQWMPCP